MAQASERPDKSPSQLSQLEFALFSQEKVRKHPEWGHYEFFSAKMLRDLLQEYDKDQGKKPPLSEKERAQDFESDQAHHRFSFFRNFYQENKRVIEDIYGAQAYQKLKKDLFKQLKQVKDLLYLKSIEDTLNKTVETRMTNVKEQVRSEMAKTYGWSFSSLLDVSEAEVEDYFSEQFRKKVEKILKHSTNLDGKAIQELRNARSIEDFEALHIRVDEDHVQSYRELVRHELEEQIKSIAEAQETGNQEEKIRSLYEKASFLIDFVVSHIDDTHGSREFTKASLLRQMQSEEGAELITSLYQQILESLHSDDTDASQRLISEMSTQFQVMSTLDRRDHLKKTLERHAPDIALTEEEIEVLFRKKAIEGEVTYFTNANGVTYHELFARGLQSIEIAHYDIALHKMLPPERRDQGVMSGCQSRIEGEIQELRQQITHFREELYTARYLISKKRDWLSNELQTALFQSFQADAIVKKEQPKKELLETLKNAKTSQDVRELIKQMDQDILSSLEAQGVSQEKILFFQKTDPFFSLANFFIAWKKEQQSSTAQEGEAKTLSSEGVGSEEQPPQKGAIITDPELSDMRVHMQQMQMITDRGFSQRHDEEAFEDSLKYLQRISKDHQYLVKEPVYDDEGRPVYRGTERMTRERWAQQELPVEDKQQLHSLLLRWEYQKNYAHLEELKRKEFFDHAENLNSPNGVRTALEALYGGFHKVNKGHNQLQKLSKVMTIDHPLTAIRMHYGKKQPFAPNGDYHLRRIDGKGDPASFLERGKDLVKKAQEYIERGDYVMLEHLLNGDHQPGQQLYYDAAFFPLKLLKDQKATQAQLFKEEYKDDKVAYVIDDDRIPGGNDRKYFEREYNRCEGPKGSFDRKHDLDELRAVSDSLADEYEFNSIFGDQTLSQAQAVAKFQDALVYNADGSVNEDASLAAFEGMQDYVTQKVGQCKGLGVPGGTKLPEEKLREIAEDYPRVAARMAQFNNMLAGGVLGTADSTLRYGGRALQFTAMLPGELFSDIWKKIDWYSPQHIWMAIDEMIDKISALTDFRVRIGAYNLLQNVFQGTLVGNEFAKLYQGEEDRRVGEFKDAFGDFGNADVIDKIYTASDQFELKAALLEGLENRGIITLEDMLDNRFFRQLNQYTKNCTIDTTHSEEDMIADEDLQFRMIDQLREAMDDIWGDGTWQSWRSAAAGKYESKRKESWDNFSGNSGREKGRYYSMYWEQLKTSEGIEALKKMHPGELVGNIEQDLEQGDNDSGVNFAIMQAMISMGIVKLDHVRRLQTAHTNDLPIHTLLEPKQAEACGLSEHIRRALQDGEKLDDGNPIVDFYQGMKTLPLQGIRVSGKWKFPNTEQDAAKAKAAGKLEDIEVTVHQLQAWREAQPRFHREMDNSCIGIFTPCYEWSQIENALDPNTQGNITARPHDIVAAYRGIHYEFGAYMDAMAKPERMKDPLTFKRTVWMAYKALCKTHAYGAFMSRQKGRDNDYNTNSFDGSPNFRSQHKEESARSGTTNFEKLILEGATGPHQRMGQSSGHLDSIESLSPELRRDFKMMAGYQHVKSLGVNPETGKADRSAYIPYNKDSFDPSMLWKKAMGSFMDHVKRLAAQHSWGAEVIGTLNASAMGDMNMDNDERQKKLNSWVLTEAKL